MKEQSTMLEDCSLSINLMSERIETTTSTESCYFPNALHSSSKSDNGSTDGDEISSTVGSSSDHGNNGTESTATKRTSTERSHLRKCNFAGGCTKNAQGKTLMCIKHGGGRRCTAFGCSKGARDKLFCSGHGGGRRCAEPDCQKSAVGGSLVCCTHGGGRKCSVPDCTKYRQSPTQFCIKHGGGRICSITGCTKVSRGTTKFCAAHGGGQRCRLHECGRAVISGYDVCRNHLEFATVISTKSSSLSSPSKRHKTTLTDDVDAVGRGEGATGRSSLTNSSLTTTSTGYLDIVNSHLAQASLLSSGVKDVMDASTSSSFVGGMMLCRDINTLDGIGGLPLPLVNMPFMGVPLVPIIATEVVQGQRQELVIDDGVDQQVNGTNKKRPRTSTSSCTSTTSTVHEVVLTDVEHDHADVNASSASTSSLSDMKEGNDKAADTTAAADGDSSHHAIPRVSSHTKVDVASMSGANGTYHPYSPWLTGQMSGYPSFGGGIGYHGQPMSCHPSMLIGGGTTTNVNNNVSLLMSMLPPPPLLSPVPLGMGLPSEEGGGGLLSSESSMSLENMQNVQALVQQLAISRQVVYQQQLTLSMMLQHAAAIQQVNNTNSNLHTNTIHTYPNSTQHDSDYMIGEGDHLNDTDSLIDFIGTSNHGLYSEGDIIESVRYALDANENNIEPSSSSASTSTTEEERQSTSATTTTTTTNNHNNNNNVVPITFV